MWILTSIFQAIGQALTWVLPVSESGHSVIFHNFSGRFSNACSQLTGVVHIGIPAGKYGNFYMVFHRTSFNKTILGEGICMALLGVLLIVTNTLINSSRNKLPDWANAIILGLIAFLALPTGGCSFMGAIFAFGILLGMSQKYAIRYAVTMSVPTLIVMGIVELCIAVTKINIFSALIGIIVSAAISFFAVKLFIFIVNKKALNYIAYYDISIGVISAIIGAFQLVIK